MWEIFTVACNTSIKCNNINIMLNACILLKILSKLLDFITCWGQFTMYTITKYFDMHHTIFSQNTFACAQKERRNDERKKKELERKMKEV